MYRMSGKRFRTYARAAMHKRVKMKTVVEMRAIMVATKI
jgi:hypothetical protein